MSFSPFSLISQEIIDEIIDSMIDSPDPCSIKARLLPCTSVCRSFRARSQKHVFKRISIGIQIGIQKTNFNDKQRLDRLDEILKENPQLASYVENIDLRYDERTLWPMDDIHLVAVMDCISNALAKRSRTLELRMSSNGSSQALVQHIGRNRLALPQLSPFITGLTLYELQGVPITLITDCHQLIKLELEKTTVESTTLKLVPHLRPRLQVFYFIYEEETVEAVDLLAEGFVDFSQLRDLYFSFNNSETPDTLKRILDLSANSLEELSFACYDNGLNRFSNAYDLSRIPNLTDIWIRDCDMFLGFDQFDPLSDLCHFFGTISRENKIKELSIHMIGPPDDEDIGLIQRLDQSNWDAFDSLLIKISHGKRLKVDIEIQYYMDESFPDRYTDPIERARVKKELGGILATWPKSHLPQATEASQIVLEFSWSLEFFY